MAAMIGGGDGASVRHCGGREGTREGRRDRERVAARKGLCVLCLLNIMDDKTKVKKELDGSLVPPPRKPKIVVSVNLGTFKLEVISQFLTNSAKNADKVTSYFASESAAKLPKKYAEPWDYDETDYPVTLPLRRPYSGDPEILDEEEFGESSGSRAQDAELTAAEQLGLMQPQSVAEPGKGPEENAEPASTSTKGRRQGTVRGTKLKDLPGGLMGKILVYKSGKVKMKIGDTLYNEVAAMNIREKHCCTLGEVSKRAVVTPDIDYLLGSVDMMEE
ncbi:hypothetical protein PR202_gb19016 [Eleusine coracana subsp. coracana]|uniref:DNA-directed RNA polymerase III subunit RPC4 n=1 Tax=Eleusine coracana subsp. coracana TaxID=191504 RepID=A0AAV5F4W7_ELECO|nr:hypothetical protein PR202_gb19016 [Eleusine coracana subsp. coracana]